MFAVLGGIPESFVLETRSGRSGADPECGSEGALLEPASADESDIILYMIGFTKLILSFQILITMPRNLR